MRTSLMLNDLQRRFASGEDPKSLLEVLDQAGRKIHHDDGRPLPPPAPPELPPAAPAPAAALEDETPLASAPEPVVETGAVASAR